MRTFRGAKRLECAELAPAFGAASVNDSASKLDALQTLRVTAMPVFPYVSVFRAAHTKEVRHSGEAKPGVGYCGVGAGATGARGFQRK